VGDPVTSAAKLMAVPLHNFPEFILTLAPGNLVLGEMVNDLL
jgi:hypothetical protein